MLWFGGNPSPSDYPNAAIPNFNMHAFVVSFFRIFRQLVQSYFQIFSVFLIPFIAYLLILPGVRRKRVITTVTYVLILVVGASLIGNHFCFSEFLNVLNHFSVSDSSVLGVGLSNDLHSVSWSLKWEDIGQNWCWDRVAKSECYIEMWVH